MESHKIRALIVSQSEKTSKVISGFLSAADFSLISSASSAGRARRLALEHKVDIVIINTPLPDDYGIQLAMDLADKNIGVLLLVKNESYDQISYKVENYGVITLPKPVSRPALIQSIKILKAMKIKMDKLEVKTHTLESKMKEIRIINRAKWILIVQMKMTEEEAHKYIEKSAMDQCLGKGVIAENIIKTYEV